MRHPSESQHCENTTGTVRRFLSRRRFLRRSASVFALMPISLWVSRAQSMYNIGAFWKKKGPASSPWKSYDGTKDGSAALATNSGTLTSANYLPVSACLLSDTYGITVQSSGHSGSSATSLIFRVFSVSGTTVSFVGSATTVSLSHSNNNSDPPAMTALDSTHAVLWTKSAEGTGDVRQQFCLVTVNTTSGVVTIGTASSSSGKYNAGPAFGQTRMASDKIIKSGGLTPTIVSLSGSTLTEVLPFGSEPNAPYTLAIAGRIDDTHFWALHNTSGASYFRIHSLSGTTPTQVYSMLTGYGLNSLAVYPISSTMGFWRRWTGSVYEGGLVTINSTAYTMTSQVFSGVAVGDPYFYTSDQMGLFFPDWSGATWRIKVATFETGSLVYSSSTTINTFGSASDATFSSVIPFPTTSPTKALAVYGSGTNLYVKVLQA